MSLLLKSIVGPIQACIQCLLHLREVCSGQLLQTSKASADRRLQAGKVPSPPFCSGSLSAAAISSTLLPSSSSSAQRLQKPSAFLPTWLEDSLLLNKGRPEYIPAFQSLHAAFLASVDAALLKSSQLQYRTDSKANPPMATER